MKPGGGIGVYSILPADADGNPDANGNPTAPCTGKHGNPATNTGCAKPIARLLGANNNDLVDPRMLMVIHEAIIQ